MKANSTHVLKTAQVIAWILFIGLCIKTGAIFISFLIGLINPSVVHSLYPGLDFSDLFEYNFTCYTLLMCLVILSSGLKAYLFYQLLLIFERINLVHPFSAGVAGKIRGISYVSVGLGILAIAGNSGAEWLMKRGAPLAALKDYLEGGGEFLLLGGIVFMIAQVFNKGIEIQIENELTV